MAHAMGAARADGEQGLAVIVSYSHVRGVLGIALWEVLSEASRDQDGADVVPVATDEQANDTSRGC